MSFDIFFKLITTLIIPSMIWYFKVKIPAKIKSDYEKMITELKSELDYETKKLEDVRNNIIDSSIKRQELLFTRKLEACDELWKEVERLEPLRNLSTYLSHIKEDEFIKGYNTNPNSELFIKSIGEMTGFEKSLEESQKNPSKLSLKRPYFSERLWALYLGHGAIISMVMFNYQSLKSGNDIRNMINYDGILALVKKAVPEKYGNLNEINNVIVPLILNEFKELILSEIKGIHQGISEDTKSIKSSKEIIEAVEALKKKRS